MSTTTEQAKGRKVLGGAVNPYALAEAVLNRRIAWNRVRQPLELLEKTLETPVAKLFDGSPGAPGPVAPARSAAKAAPKNAQARTTAKLDVGAGLALSPQISETLRRRLVDILVPIGPALRETEYPGATWIDPGDFFDEGTEFGDPVQGAVGDCWLIAALSSVAWTRPYAIVQRNRTTGPSDDQFVDMLEFAGGNGGTARFEVSEKVPVSNGTLQPLYARSAETGEIWPCVYEKAFAKFRSGNLTDKPDIRCLGGGDCVDASAKLVPGLKPYYHATASNDANALWKLLQDNSVANPVPPGAPPLALFTSRAGRTVNPMTAWTYGRACDAPDRIAYDADSGIVGNHCYSVLGWMSMRVLSVGVRPHGLVHTTRYVVLRNPWGMHEGKVDVLDGEWAARDVSWTRSTPLNARGVFAMTIEAFKKYYAGLGVAR